MENIVKQSEQNRSTHKKNLPTGIYIGKVVGYIVKTFSCSHKRVPIQILWMMVSSFHAEEFLHSWEALFFSVYDDR